MGASSCGATLEIPPCGLLMSNRGRSSRSGTLHGGQFDWGGRLPKRNGGARRSPQAEWKPAVECKDIRGLDCERDISSRCESRS